MGSAGVAEATVFIEAMAETVLRGAGIEIIEIDAATSAGAGVGSVRVGVFPLLVLVVAIQNNPATAGNESPTSHHLFMSGLTSDLVPYRA